MTTAQEHQTDIVDMLIDDHRTVEGMFEDFREPLGLEERDDLFRRLTSALVQHEVAEEETVYPALRRLGDQGAEVAGARIHEQAEAEELLRTMEQLDVMGEEFDVAFHRLEDAVLQHAQLEESTVFPVLRNGVSRGDRAAMGSRYEHARETAPTHPHPHAPDTPPGNLIVGPVAALADRVRDAFRSIPGSGGAEPSPI